MKYPLNYAVRYSRAPGETADVAVPAIVDRNQPTELETVVENCIDRGLIAGLKPTAAHGIAEGIAEQLARELTLGHGIQFGQYFYGRQYLSGTVDANGRLTSANSVNVRLYKGNAFKLKLGDYALHFVGSGDAPRIDFIVCDGDGVRGQVVKGASVKINGRFLYSAGDTVKVCFQKGTDAAVEVTTFTAVSDELLTFACPDALVSGGDYRYWVERTDANGITRKTDAKPVTVKGAAPSGDEPEITNGYSNGHMDDPGKAYGGSAFMLEGSRFGTDAGVKIGYTSAGQHREGEVAPEEMAVNDTYIEIYDSSVALMAALGAGGTITFTVETDAGISNVYTAQVVS